MLSEVWNALACMIKFRIRIVSSNLNYWFEFFWYFKYKKRNKYVKYGYEWNENKKAIKEDHWEYKRLGLCAAVDEIHDRGIKPTETRKSSRAQQVSSRFYSVRFFVFFLQSGNLRLPRRMRPGMGSTPTQTALSARYISFWQLEAANQS